MKHSKMEIYEPAMCCETGLCGTSIDPELLRVSSAVPRSWLLRTTL